MLQEWQTKQFVPLVQTFFLQYQLKLEWVSIQSGLLFVRMLHEFIIRFAALKNSHRPFASDVKFCFPLCKVCGKLILVENTSTIITAPSTIKPKSIAPKLMRLALTPNTFIIPNANNMDKGIAEATIKPARKFPRNKTKTKITINAPSNQDFSLLLTYSTVYQISSVQIRFNNHIIR
jgi:hypothetical protein